MSDTIDGYKDQKDLTAALRKVLGVECSRCKTQRPKAHPKILLPGQRCFDGYRDAREYPDDATLNEMLKPYGFRAK